MQSIQSVLNKFNPVEDKYISREFQSYGIYLSQQLKDEDHKSLYIKLAKTVPRAILEKALSFVSDANAKSKVKLFMWKMKELKKPVNKELSAFSYPFDKLRTSTVSSVEPIPSAIEGQPSAKKTTRKKPSAVKESFGKIKNKQLSVF